MSAMKARGGCQCGAVTFRIEGEPLFRAFCHCTICQSFNAADFADIIVLRGRDISIDGQDHIQYKNHAWPPIIHRGRCKKCDGVAIETMTLPLFPAITIVPHQTVAEASDTPDPAFHMFYHRRVRDMDDDLSKKSHYLPSQAKFSSSLLAALAKGSKSS